MSDFNSIYNQARGVVESGNRRKKQKGKSVPDNERRGQTNNRRADQRNNYYFFPLHQAADDSPYQTAQNIEQSDDGNRRSSNNNIQIQGKSVRLDIADDHQANARPREHDTKQSPEVSVFKKSQYFQMRLFS